MSDFHVMKHILVPEHQLVEEKEEQNILDKYGILKEDLPKIMHSDPCVALLEEKHGMEIVEGRIIRIVRPSDTAGESVGYRLVIW
ncbi:MAG TPA: DNA-directed RNA polymerase subunit H [Euryarchaeota archaeon]|nr:DNA-directed RNA polymerase subunit H [Euryarchaeota archaeon]